MWFSTMLISESAKSLPPPIILPFASFFLVRCRNVNGHEWASRPPFRARWKSISPRFANTFCSYNAFVWSANLLLSIDTADHVAIRKNKLVSQFTGVAHVTLHRSWKLLRVFQADNPEPKAEQRQRGLFHKVGGWNRNVRNEKKPEPNFTSGRMDATVAKSVDGDEWYASEKL